MNIGLESPSMFAHVWWCPTFLPPTSYLVMLLICSDNYSSLLQKTLAWHAEPNLNLARRSPVKR